MVLIMRRIHDDLRPTARLLRARRSNHCDDATRRAKAAGQYSSIFHNIFAPWSLDLKRFDKNVLELAGFLPATYILFYTNIKLKTLDPLLWGYWLHLQCLYFQSTVWTHNFLELWICSLIFTHLYRLSPSVIYICPMKNSEPECLLNLVFSHWIVSVYLLQHETSVSPSLVLNLNSLPFTK